MVLADQSMNGGANREILRNAFVTTSLREALHCWRLGAALAGSAPKLTKKGAAPALDRTTINDINKRKSHYPYPCYG